MRRSQDEAKRCEKAQFTGVNEHFKQLFNDILASAIVMLRSQKAKYLLLYYIHSPLYDDLSRRKIAMRKETIKKVIFITMITIFMFISVPLKADSGQVGNIKVGDILEVSVASLNIRDAPPQFNWKTVLTFKYSINPPIGVLKQGARISAQEVRLVGEQQQWVRIELQQKSSIIKGWIYVGQYPDITNVKIVQSLSTNQNDAPSLSSLFAPTKNPPYIFHILSLFTTDAHATQEQANQAHAEFPQQAPTTQVMIVQLVYIIIFVLAFITFYKITKDKWLTSLGSISVLLIFGFLSQSSFVSLISAFTSTLQK